MANERQTQTYDLTGLAAWCRRTGTSFGALAAASGVSRPHLSRLARGQRRANRGTALLILTVVPPEELEIPADPAEAK